MDTKEKRESITRVVDDLMNFSMDSLALSASPLGGDQDTDVMISQEDKTEVEKQQAITEKTPQETPVKIPEEKPVEELPAEVELTDEKPIDEKPTEEKPTEEKPIEEKPTEEKPVDDMPHEESIEVEQEKHEEPPMLLHEEPEEKQVVKQDEDEEQKENIEPCKPVKEFAHMSFQSAIGNNSFDDNQEAEETPTELKSINKTTTQEVEQQEKREQEIKTKEKPKDSDIETMEFTKNYSDDLLMGQTDGSQTGGVDLADYELPPYSGSSSGSEPRQQSPVKRKSSSSSSAQPTSSLQPPTVNFMGIKYLLKTSYSNASHVLLWKKPIETGIYFAIGVTLIAAFTFFSIISVVAYSALGVIMTSGLIRVYKSVMQTLNKSPETPFDHVWDSILIMDMTISQEKVHEFIDVSLGTINSFLTYFKQVLLFEDKIATVKFGLYFYLLTYIGSWFNGMTLITLCYLALFSLPIAYEKNKTQVDQYLNMINVHVCTTANKVTSMVFGNSKNGSGNKKQK